MKPTRQGIYSIRGSIGNTPETDKAQQALNEALAANVVVYQKLLCLAAIIEGLYLVVNPDLVDAYIELRNNYAERQSQLLNKNKPLIQQAVTGIKQGWEWLVNKFSTTISINARIGALPLIPIAIVAGAVAVGAAAYAIPEFYRIKREADSDITKLDSLLTSYNQLAQTNPQAAKALLPYINQSSQAPNYGNKEGSIFDDINKLLWTGGGIALAVWGVPKVIEYLNNRKKQTA